MTTPYPRAILNGVHDMTPDTIARVLEQVPQHLPYVYLFTRRGTTAPQLVEGTAFATLFDTRSLDTKYQYVTHQTALAIAMFQTGNSCYVHRMQPPNSATAFLRLSVEAMPAQIPVYVRNTDGSIAYSPDSSGVSTPNVSGYVNGTQLIHRIGLAGYSGINAEYGKALPSVDYRTGGMASPSNGTVRLGVLPDEVIARSTLYPIADFQLPDFGVYGNQYGLRLTGLTQVDSTKVSLAQAIGAYLYQFTCVSTDDNGLVTVQGTVAGTPTVSCGLVSSLRDPNTSADLALDTGFVSAYGVSDNSGMNDVPPPFGTVKMYSRSIAVLLQKLVNGYTHQGIPIVGEAAYDTQAASYGRNLPFGTAANVNMFNIFTGVDEHNVPYFSCDQANSYSFGGVALGSNSPMYASGGSDGLVVTNGMYNAVANLEIFDGLVAEQLRHFGTLVPEVLDIARMPFSIFYDTGFALETKKLFVNPLNARKDCAAVVSTYSVADYVGSEIPVVIPPLGAPTVTFADDANSDGVIVPVEYIDPTTIAIGIPAGTIVGTAWTADLGQYGIRSGQVSSAQLAAGVLVITLNVIITPLPEPILTFPADPNATGSITAPAGANTLIVKVTVPTGSVLGDTWSVDSAGFGSTNGVVDGVAVANGYIQTHFMVSTNVVFSVSGHFDHGQVGGTVGNASVAYLAAVP